MIDDAFEAQFPLTICSFSIKIRLLTQTSTDFDIDRSHYQLFIYLCLHYNAALSKVQLETAWLILKHCKSSNMAKGLWPFTKF